MIRTTEQWARAIARNREIALVSDLESACQITYGRYFWPLEPTHIGNDFDIEFIAHSLATKTRWAGVMADQYQYPIGYTVAQHSCIVAELVERRYRQDVAAGRPVPKLRPTKYALLHDGSEAYLEDVPRPIKPRLGDYYPIEAALMAKIIEVFDVPYDADIKSYVRTTDDNMIFWERDHLVGQPVVPYPTEYQHPGSTLIDQVPDFFVWPAHYAKDRFLEMFAEIEAAEGRIAA